MKKEDFSLINDYFNNLSVFLFESKDFEDNYYNFIVLNDKYIDYFSKRYFTEGAYHVEIKNNNISFQEVVDLAGEIIRSISEKYYEKFNGLLDSGVLDFSYDQEYEDSHVRHEFYNGELKRRLININRSFNYTDVEVLIHEFMHYICYVGESIKDKVLGELISIYFELYADEYMYMNKKVNIEELFYNKRLLNIFYQSNWVKNVEIPLFIYKTFGDIDENSYTDVKPFFGEYKKENYDYECSEVLKIINNNDKNKINIYNAHFYIMATLFAYYFRKKNNINDILNLVENINNNENKDLDLLELLSKYNLNVEKDIIKVPFEAMDEYLDIFEQDKKQR